MQDKKLMKILIHC